jgi:hypothetical protein
MLVEDSLTGWVHEVPDADMYGGYGEYPEELGEAEVVYDGFGNPVGLLPALTALAPLAAKALPFLASKAIPAAAGLVRRILPIAQGAARQIPGMIRRLLPFPPQMPGMPPMPFRPRLPFPMIPRPLPPGWMRPTLPYTGPAPRRVYMRCSTWPGPPGLVPRFPGAPTPPPGLPQPQYRRRRSLRRRRRR